MISFAFQRVPRITIILGLFVLSACVVVRPQPAPPESGFIALLENSGSTRQRDSIEAFASRGIEFHLMLGSLSPVELLRTAERYLERRIPYRLGGKSLRALDCSGYVRLVFLEHGVVLPHSAEDMARYGRIIDDPERLSPGDLVFFTRTYRSRDYITHVGISLGGSLFIHTSNYLGVRVSSLEEPYWMRHYIFGTRVFHGGERA